MSDLPLRRFDSYYTDARFCRVLVATLLDRGLLQQHHSVREPHAGAGGFVEALLGQVARVHASDLNPAAPCYDGRLEIRADRYGGIGEGFARGLRLYPPCDARSTLMEPRPVGSRDETPLGPMPVDWTLGNPPFGEYVAPETCSTCEGTGYRRRRVPARVELVQPGDEGAELCKSRKHHQGPDCPGCSGTGFKSRQIPAGFEPEDGTGENLAPCSACRDEGAVRGRGLTKPGSRPVLHEMIAAARAQSRVGVAFVLPVYAQNHWDRADAAAGLFEWWPINPRLKFVGSGTAQNEYGVGIWLRAPVVSSQPFRPLTWRDDSDEGVADGQD